MGILIFLYYVLFFIESFIEMRAYNNKSAENHSVCCEPIEIYDICLGCQDICKTKIIWVHRERLNAKIFI